MKQALLVLLCFQLAGTAAAAPRAGLHLPSGEPRDVRERDIDITKLDGSFRVDMQQGRLAGDLRVTFEPLRDDVTEAVLDAADLNIRSVSMIDEDGQSELPFKLQERQLVVGLPEGAHAGTPTTVRIRYEAAPNTGLYFFQENKWRSAEAWNYGEGGLHYNWLPMYNDTNDRFAVEFQITVDDPYVALSNGTLQDVKENKDGSRTFHWSQDEPIANYLIALNVGRFIEVPLRAASVGGRDVPLSVWTSAGREDAAAYSFRNTPAMVEFYSALLGFDYPWDKYDQVTLRNFAIGAMETATMVGFNEQTLGLPGDMLDDGQDLTAPRANWSRDDTISHELAHHWFGDLVTCRSLGSIWLNESFATYLNTIWTAHSMGDDELTRQRWLFLNTYLDFVATEGEVRPLEYSHFNTADDVYTEEITYIKGAIVLHQLRHFLGDEVFYRALRNYLHQYAFSEADSFDLQRALETASGRNLNWFFDDWIREGGGYPVLSVTDTWAPERSEVDISISQIQTILPYQDLFTLPIDIEVVTKSGSTMHQVLLSEAGVNVALPADSEPLMVIVDKGNWLVADVHHELTIDQLIYRIHHGDTATALRSTKQIAEDYPRRSQAVAALTEVVADDSRFIGVRQQAAISLGAMGGADAVMALADAAAQQNVAMRRAAAIALGHAGGRRSEQVLMDLVAKDDAEEVVGAAAIALGSMQTPAAADTLRGLLDRESRYNDVLRHSALIGLDKLGDAALAGEFKRFIDEPYDRRVRGAAISAWVHAAPRDRDLGRELQRLANDPDMGIRLLALQSLGQLHRAADLDFLNSYAVNAVDPNLQYAAQQAADAVAQFVKD